METKFKVTTEYKAHKVKCEKCNELSVIETDYLTESQAKQVHKCKRISKIKSKNMAGL